MDKIKIGIPRALHFYYQGSLWQKFFEELGYEVIISKETDQEIIEKGCSLANDEMCLSLKIYLGHVWYLQNICDYIFIPRIDNYGLENQTCTNFLALYDIVNNLCKAKLLDMNIDQNGGNSEVKAFLKLGKKLGKGKEQIKLAYYNSLMKAKRNEKKQKVIELEKLNSNRRKLLLISHPYNTKDAMMGKSILSFLKPYEIEVIDSYTLGLQEPYPKTLSPTLYFKYNKEIIAPLDNLEEKIDGVLFLSTFPCGPDSLVNELMLRKLKVPYLNIIIDDVQGMAGIETRIESFIDILEQRKQKI